MHTNLAVGMSRRNVPLYNVVYSSMPMLLRLAKSCAEPTPAGGEPGPTTKEPETGTENLRKNHVVEPVVTVCVTVHVRWKNVRCCR